MLLGLVLLYVGAVLFINGLSLLSLVDTRETAIMNIFTGVIAFLVCIHTPSGVAPTFRFNPAPRLTVFFHLPVDCI